MADQCRKKPSAVTDVRGEVPDQLLEGHLVLCPMAHHGKDESSKPGQLPEPVARPRLRSDGGERRARVRRGRRPPELSIGRGPAVAARRPVPLAPPCSNPGGSPEWDIARQRHRLAREGRWNCSNRVWRGRRAGRRPRGVRRRATGRRNTPTSAGSTKGPRHQNPTFRAPTRSGVRAANAVHGLAASPCGRGLDGRRRAGRTPPHSAPRITPHVVHAAGNYGALPAWPFHHALGETTHTFTCHP